MERGESRGIISRQLYFTQLSRTICFGSWELFVGS
jgi:hypothetical protein